MMTVHVLHAGDGYSYLTRQVATADVSRDQGKSLSDYYMQHGNPPGRWVGAGLDALGVSGTVDEKQMRALFGEGLHPDAERLTAEAVAAGKSPDAALAAARLGRRFPQFETPDDPFPARLAEAYAEFRARHDRTPEPGVERDLIRWNVAGEVLTEQHDGVPPTDADRARFLATRGQAVRQPVAGYDLVFTPVKSVSVLWGLGDENTRRAITEAHEAAWRDALEWIEREGAFTRTGAGGPAQIDTHGLVATAFDHMDSRTGDPNLHTHVAVSNKVLGIDGKWRALDGRVIHALGVAASERYNTNIENELRQRLGVEFVDEERRAGRQAVREVAGIDQAVRRAFSRRRAAVEESYERLLGEYRAKYGHEAPRGMQFRLAQQATLETRGAKDTIVPLRQRLGEWRTAAAKVLGSEKAVDTMCREALHKNGPATNVVDVRGLVDKALDNLAAKRATWGRFHIDAEAMRLAREHVTADMDVHRLAQDIVEGVRAVSLEISAPDLNETPGELQRSSGESIYTVHGSEKFTSLAVLEAEDALVRAAREPGGFTVDGQTFEQALSSVESATGRAMNSGQRAMAERFARGGHRIEVGIGPAGAGKTTAMTAFARAVAAAGGRVVGLAPSAAAAAVLGEELGASADTLHKLLDAHARAATPGRVTEHLALDERTVLLVDEAGMAGTPELAAVLALAAQRGAAVRLLGDPAQLSAVGAGGALRLIAEQAGAARLDEIHRFADTAEAAASLMLRDGDARALTYYVDAGRTSGGSRDDMVDDLYAAWWNDQTSGRRSVMIAATTDDVVTLSGRARLDRIAAGLVEADGADLHDGTRAGVGDIVVTRLNDRRLSAGRTDYVKNGDLWTVTGRGRGGALRVQHVTTRARATLPADYVAHHVELGYAATIHRVQGMTVDTSHTLVGAGTTREQLYTAATRGRHSNRLYVVVDELLDVDAHSQPGPRRAVTAALEHVVARTGAEVSASATLEHEWDQAHSLSRLVPAYEDAYARLLDAERDERVTRAIHLAVPTYADRITADPAWPTLAARLAQHEATGVDVVELLQRAASERGFDGAESIARVLFYRVEEPRVLDVDARALPGWITPAPDAVLTEQYEAPRIEAHVSPADLARAVEVNDAAWAWWSAQRAAESWATEYMDSRGLGSAEWGVAPATWTGLVDHLVGQGYAHDDLVAAGVATTTRDGRLIDRFRDRIVFPVRDGAGDVIAVTARINPASDDAHAPKYLNTPETIAYRKREVLYGLDPEARRRLADGARPVLVEGPTDVAAVRLAAPEVVPVAACGTGVTEQQLDLLRTISGRDLSHLVVATDDDAAGQKAAARVWEMLTPAEAGAAQGLALGQGQDPGQMVEDGAAHILRDRIEDAAPLTHRVIDGILTQYRLDEIEGRVLAVRDASRTVAEHVDRSQMADVAAHLGNRLASLGMDLETIADETVSAALDAAPSPSPLRREINPHVAGWLNRQADLMAARLDTLVDDVAQHRPAWAASITDLPDDVGARDQWTAAVRQIAAYRDRYQIHTTDPLGPHDVTGQQKAARAAAAAALTTVTRDEMEPAAAAVPRRSMDRVQQMLAKARERQAEQARQEAERRQRAERERQQQTRDRGTER